MATLKNMGNLNCDTKSQINNNYLEEDKNVAAYLDYEDFSHSGLGLETYTDGVQHPLELRKILIGDLSQEMSVSFRLNADEGFKALVHPNSGRHGGVEIYDSTGRVVTGYAANLPKPPKLIKASSTITPFIGSLWDGEPSLEALQQEDDDIQNLLSQQQRFSGRKPGRPPAQQGTYDPESGTIRYVCRLDCGASLASAKGRRKHEKKHCPNVPKDQYGAFPMYYNAGNLLGHSLFGGSASTPPPRLPKKQEWFECRICGKVLKTYEGRRLHEKLQHLPKKTAPPVQKSSQIQQSVVETPISETVNITDMTQEEPQDEGISVVEEDYGVQTLVDEEEEDEEDDEVEDDLEDNDD